jgi:hypothetical protein
VTSDELEPVRAHPEFAFPTTEYRRQYAWPTVLAPTPSLRAAGVATTRSPTEDQQGGTSDVDSNAREYDNDEAQAATAVPGRAVETPTRQPRRRQVNVGDPGKTVKRVHEFYPDEVRISFFVVCSPIFLYFVHFHLLFSLAP